ncbi:MAG: hypothetical protein JW807_08050 [Spirochaetes bacterium]|nr:hypothetical protein [Spirochaetota bacterium]
MQVLINDCPVDFKLDGGQKVSDVVESVSAWTRERNLIFYELYIDNDRFAIDAVPDMGLSGVKIINCIVQSRADIVFSSVDEAARYCERASSFVARALETGELKREDAENMVGGVSWLLEVLARVMNLLGLGGEDLKYKDSELSRHVESIEGFRDALSSAGDADRALEIVRAQGDIYSEIKQMFRILLLSDAMRSLIVQSIDSPDVLIASIRETREGLDEQLANIQAAAVAFQTGKDREGSERLKNFVDFIYRYTRTCYQLVPMFRLDLAEVEVDGVSLETKNRDLRSLLHEVSSIMENNDIISLSDVLEYEMLPSLENLAAYIGILLDRISRD